MKRSMRIMRDYEHKLIFLYDHVDNTIGGWYLFVIIDGDKVMIIVLIYLKIYYILLKIRINLAEVKNFDQ